MTPQERDLIQNVFDRLSKLAGGAKDAQAEALIAERMRAVPDAAYNLVEAVVVQEMAIKERDARIGELERHLAAAPPPQQQQAGGFAQGPANPWGRGSVPSVPPQPQQYAPPPQFAPQPQQYGQPQGAWGQPAGGGGSFLRTAAGAAVGVAGGMLLANSISGMFAGGHAGGHAGGSPWGGGATPASETITENTTVNNYYGSAPPAPPAGDVAPQYDTNVADTGGYDGGGFDTGGWDDGGSDSF
ncbi:MAG: DUF2076 domain-containing protein [Magnetospirillum sp.]|nr:MAG: DUF2076 domain-containing protein [Magnetospirillum sp.]